MNRGGALAIFVKTPGLSPVKTRLAVSIGVAEAERFYDLSIRATRAVAQNLKQTVAGLDVYWSVAEPTGIQASIWNAFPRIYQGEGMLGERLGHVYDHLLKTHNYVCFIGADSPHLTVQELTQAIAKTAVQESFVLGETLDGGFYFFGGSRPLSRELWQSIEYSSSSTAHQLGIALRPFGRVEYVQKSFDIDVAEDLDAYKGFSLSSSDLLSEQLDVIAWARGIK